MDTQSLFSLAGRTALVTGGSRGIGKMIATGFIAQGAKVYISSRKADVCEAVAEELGPNCIAVSQDISTVDGCKALAATMAEHEASIDILVNNAGAAWGESFETFPEAGWDKVMNLNVKSIFFLTQAMHGLLKASASDEQPSKVINIASIDGLRLNPWETYSYQASKGRCDQPDQAARSATGERRHSGDRHRTRGVCIRDEQGSARSGRHSGSACACGTYRQRRGYGRCRHLSRISRR